MYLCNYKSTIFATSTTTKIANNMKTQQPYATIVKMGKFTFAIVDSANQCVFATPSERQAKNMLAKILKAAGY